MDVRIGLWRKLSAEELMLLNCGVREDSWESLGLQGYSTSPSKGDQPWDFFGKNDAKAETAVLWPPHAKSWLIGKDSDFGRDWEQEEKGTTEDEMAWWHHRVIGHEFQWTPGVGDGHGGLACCSSWDCKEADMTEWLNWTELIFGIYWSTFRFCELFMLTDFSFPLFFLPPFLFFLPFPLFLFSSFPPSYFHSWLSFSQIWKR